MTYSIVFFGYSPADFYEAPKTGQAKSKKSGVRRKYSKLATVSVAKSNVFVIN